MSIPWIISRWFGHELPPFEEATKTARAAKRPWVSKEAYKDFASVDDGGLKARAKETV
jgi:hypothetical protein